MRGLNVAIDALRGIVESDEQNWRIYEDDLRAAEEVREKLRRSNPQRNLTTQT